MFSQDRRIVSADDLHDLAVLGGSDALDATEAGDEFFLEHRADAWHLVEERCHRRLAVPRAVRSDREPVCFVADALEEVQPFRALR